MNHEFIFLNLSTVDYHHLKAVRVKVSRYQESVSLGAFSSPRRTGKTKRNTDPHRKVSWHWHWPDDYARSQESMRRIREQHGIETGSYPDPVLTFESAWDFYDYIGYDYKTKKFLPER